MDKLTIINRALSATGNSLTSLNDGTPEWQVTEIAFDRAVDDLMSQHGWPFGRTRADLVQVPDSASSRYRYAYRLPDNLLHLRGVYLGGHRTDLYEIFGRAVSVNATGNVSIEYVFEPPDAEWHPQATEILTLMMEIACLRGLNEDYAEASIREQRLDYRLAQSKQVVDSEKGTVNVMRPAARDARRTRRG